MSANSKQPALKINQWLDQATEKLKAVDIPTARLDAELLLAHALKKDRTWLIAHSDESADFTEVDKLLTKRVQRTPLAYLTGHKEFYGREFIVSPDVLVPRPESEAIIDVIKELPLLSGPNIYDVGTGSGCLAVTIALELPASFVHASDISIKAIQVARQNAVKLNANNTSFRTDRLMATHYGPWDAIVANLPYVDLKWQRSPETEYEPALALFAHDHGLELIKQCISQASTRLLNNGYLLLEADPDQHATIIAFSAQHGFKHLRTDGYIVTLQRV